MYAITHSLSNHEGNPEICDIEVGLSQGIPIIKYFGDISQQYSRSRDKIHFIFSYLGRRIKSKKIRVNFAAHSTIDDQNVDLAVVAALYLASNNTEIDSDVYAYGRVDMKGNVSSGNDLAKLLYLISGKNDGEAFLFTGENVNNFQSLYPKIKIISVANVSQLFKYFEGAWEPSTVTCRPHEEFSSKPLFDNMLHSELSYITLKTRSKMLCIENTETESKVLDHNLNYPKSKDLTIDRLNAIFTPQLQKFPFIWISSSYNLNMIHKPWARLPKEAPLYIDLTSENRDSILLLIRLLRKKEPTTVIILVSNCGCNLNKSKEGECFCNSRAKDQWAALLRELARKTDLAYFEEAPNTDLLTDNDYLKSGITSKRLKQLKTKLSENRDNLIEIL